MKESFITLQSFMVDDLKLKGNELIIYAIIYGFSQDNSSKYTGTLSYLQKWTNSTKQGVLKSLNNLLEKELIVKHTTEMVNRVYYSTKFNGKESLPSMVNKVDPSIKQSLPNNIDNNIDNKIEEKKTRKEKDNETFEEWWALYPKKSSKPKARTKWGNMTITNQKLALEGLKQQLPYLKTRSMEYIPYPTTWLNQERWNDPIETLKNGKVKATPSWVEDYKKDLETKEQERKEQQQFTEQELKELRELFS